MYGLRFVIAGEDGFMGGIVALWHCGIVAFWHCSDGPTIPGAHPAHHSD